MLSQILDWAVVAVPIVVGLMQWVIPIREPKRTHKVAVLIGCILFSVLLWMQQNVARQEHARELSGLPTKDDLKRLPSTSEIVGEFKRIAPAGVNQSPWGLTDSQLAKLTERISVYAPFSPENTGEQIITCVMGDESSMRFASQLAQAFSNAHWRGFKDGSTSQSMFSSPFEGVQVLIRDRNDNLVGLNEIMQTFEEAGIEVHGYVAQSVPKDEFRIQVGLRPANVDTQAMPHSPTPNMEASPQ